MKKEIMKTSTSADKLLNLARKRTELAQERTILTYIRTAATLVLFSIAFFGLSATKWDFFFTSGAIAILIGVIFLIIAAIRWLKHSREIEEINAIFYHKKK